MHELFQKWKHKIFTNDPATRKKLFQLLGESEPNEKENQNRQILQ